MVAAAPSTRAAFRVATRGRKRPVASANPATAPVASAAGVAATQNTVPDVPMGTITSPSTAPTPRAAAALSPAPGPTPKRPAKAGPSGPNTPGTTGSPP